jgi:hypothetical protein
MDDAPVAAPIGLPSRRMKARVAFSDAPCRDYLLADGWNWP